MANGLDSLSSPLVVLGGLWWAGENKRNFTGGANGMDLLAGGFGASSAQWGGEQLRGIVGGDTLTENLSQALFGVLVSNFGDPIPQNDAIARGIHYNVAQQAFSEAGLAAGDLIGDVGLGGGAGGTTGGGGDTTESTDGGNSVNGDGPKMEMTVDEVLAQ